MLPKGHFVVIFAIRHVVHTIDDADRVVILELWRLFEELQSRVRLQDLLKQQLKILHSCVFFIRLWAQQPEGSVTWCLRLQQLPYLQELCSRHSLRLWIVCTSRYQKLGEVRWYAKYRFQQSFALLVINLICLVSDCCVYGVYEGLFIGWLSFGKIKLGDFSGRHGHFVVEGFSEDRRLDQRGTGVSFVHGFSWRIVLIREGVPLSSMGPRGGVMVLLKMAEELRCRLLMGTLWCEKRGLGYLYDEGCTQWP